MKMSVPRCFASRRQYELWLEAARAVPPGSSGYCADCTPEYQRQMIAARRCAYPTTSFQADADGYVEGRRPAEACRRLREAA